MSASNDYAAAVSSDITVVFQPIVRLGTDEAYVEVHGVEALARGPRGSELESADHLFAWARRYRLQTTIDFACMRKALSEVTAADLQTEISLNVHASTVADRKFLDFFCKLVKDSRVAAEQLTLEVVEHGKIEDVRTFSEVVRELRTMRVRLAVDDLGIGQSNCRMVVQCLPDYLKIDRYFVHGSRGDFHRRAVLESVATLGRELDARVVAEGIEDAEDLSLVMECGIHFAQGYFFARPMPLRELLATRFFATARCASI